MHKIFYDEFKKKAKNCAKNDTNSKKFGPG